MSYVIGLTGNMGTGKSTVLQILRELGAQVIDADAVTRQVMRRGEPAFDAIVAEFGPEVVGPDGELDRAALARRVFSDPAALRRLEEIVHPATVARVREEIARATAPVVVVEAIKLLEAGMARELCDAVWVVDAPEEVCIARLAAGRGISPEEARRRLAAQTPQAEKRAAADVVIDNSGDLEETRRQVLEAWQALPVWGRAGKHQGSKDTMRMVLEQLRRFWERHPRLSSWVLLSAGMLAVFFWAARDVSATPAQRLVMAASTVLLAGACVWIIYWE